MLRALAVSLALAMFLAGCGGATTANVPPAPTLARLPSVTPVRPATSPPPARVVTVEAIPAPTPPPTPLPAATPGVVQTEDGPVTATMARLGLAAEPYATLGDPAAPITVIEFTDFGCAFCRQFHLRTFGALRAEYIDTGKVFYVVKDLPVTSRQGALAAQAAECGGEQGRYWELHDELFFEPEAWAGDEAAALARIRSAGDAAGLDGQALEACVSEGRQVPNIDRNFAEAQALRVYATPAFFINGKLLAGAHSPEVWREILDGELGAGAGGTSPWRHARRQAGG